MIDDDERAAIQGLLKSVGLRPETFGTRHEDIPITVNAMKSGAVFGSRRDKVPANSRVSVRSNHLNGIVEHALKGIAPRWAMRQLSQYTRPHHYCRGRDDHR
jgi:hypothetical protein